MESFLVTCTSNTCERPVLNLLCWPAQAIWDELTHIITKAKKSIKMKDVEEQQDGMLLRRASLLTS